MLIAKRRPKAIKSRSINLRKVVQGDRVAIVPDQAGPVADHKGKVDQVVDPEVLVDQVAVLVDKGASAVDPVAHKMDFILRCPDRFFLRLCETLSN